jgi:hypothetical protein
VTILFALLIPVLFALAAIVLDIGNWYVHKRHLQTQVDAAVLAAAPSFVGCFQGRDGANAAIARDALSYAGDTIREPSTANVQLQEPDDVRIVLNSARYWQQSDGLVPGTNGYGLDNTVATPGDPCSLSYLDAKATDDEAPLLWGLLPLKPSPKTHAKVEIRDVIEANGVLPLAVPEVDPQAVAALFVNEENGTVIAALELAPAPCPDPNYPFSCWAIDFPQVELNYDNVGVVVLVSRDNRDPDLDGTLAEICGREPGYILCYAGDGNDDGLSFIHGYSSGGAATLQAPRIRDVTLFDVNCAQDYSSPYFLMNGECDVGIRAVVDFGQPLGDDHAIFDKCVRVFANVAGELGYGGDVPEGTVFAGTFSLSEASGRNRVDLTWESRNPARNNCNQPTSGSFGKVAAPYVADDASGPVQYVLLQRSNPFGLANSTEKSPQPQTVRVTVGLQRPLQVLDAREPPILLRLGSNPGSQTQAVDCDRAGLPGEVAGPHSNFVNEFLDGCLTWYRENYGDWSTPPDGTNEWQDIDCSEHPFGNQPPPDQFNDPTPNCVAIQTGVTAGQFRQGLEGRFASPCTPNNWPPMSATDDEVNDFFENYNFANDPRYVTLIVADFTAFQGSGSSAPRPIKIFAGFYYTGSGSVSCPGDDPHPLGVTGQRARFDMWGHYVIRVEFTGSATPSDRLCNFTNPQVGNCVAVLVE